MASAIPADHHPRISREPSRVMPCACEQPVDDRSEYREGIASHSLEALIEQFKGRLICATWLDDDILGEPFENTEIADRFVEHIE
jgi:hypothetical protein